MRSFSWRAAGALLVLLAGCDLTTDPEVVSVRITPDGGTLEALQDTLALVAEARDGAGRIVVEVPVSWTSLEPEVASVDSTGRVVSRSPGTARVVAVVGEAADTAAVTVASGVPSGALRFVELADNTPLATYDTTFWVKKGQGREIEVRTAPTPGDEDGEEVLEFEVGGDALLRYPGGRPFAKGDSVAIRLRLDAERFLFHFEPSGLQFDPDHPATLEIQYRLADPSSLEREGEFDLWKQESPDSPWVRIATVQMEDFDEIEAEITSFTAFSLATH